MDLSVSADGVRKAQFNPRWQDVYVDGFRDANQKMTARTEELKSLVGLLLESREPDSDQESKVWLLEIDMY